MIRLIAGPPTPALGLESDVTRRRHDILTMMEAGRYVPPVAFETYDLLEAWAITHGLGKPQKAKPAKLTSAVKVVGRFRHPDWLPDHSLPYRQIWVRKSYDGYVDVMRNVMKDLVTDVDVLRSVDADHVVGRTILKEFPNSWINIFPVWGTANRSFGSIEKKLPKANAGFGTIFLSPLTTFKILRNDKKIETAEDLNDEISVATRRILATGQTALDMRTNMGEAVRNVYSGWLMRRAPKKRAYNRKHHGTK